MKILCIGPNFLHPTTKGGQIRTLGILRCLAREHEIHYVAFEDPAHPEAADLAREYCYRAYPVRHDVISKRSPRFLGQLAAGLFSPVPVAVRRYQSQALNRFLAELIEREHFDRILVDFLVMAGCCPRPERTVLFQHNVETMIWRRRAEHARDPLHQFYFNLQARRMFEYERAACRGAGHVVAVSRVDADLMRTMFGIERVSEIPTGVDLEYFERPGNPRSVADLVFAGSMDWLPNVDGILYFAREILPLIRRRRPELKFVITGRTPPPEIAALAEDPRTIVTGTVPDIRPYVWGSLVSIVPLRIGGGTRLKIYESMAAGVPVVSTPVGAEGLDVHDGADIRLAADPESFAAACLELLENEAARRRIAEAGWKMVAENFSWERVARLFAAIIEDAPAAAPHA